MNLYSRPNNLAAEFARRKVTASGSMDALANQIRSEMGITKNTGSVPGGPSLGGQSAPLTHRSYSATPNSSSINGISGPVGGSPRQDLSNRWGTGLISDGRDWKADFEALDRAIQDGTAVSLGTVGGQQPMRDTNMGMVQRPFQPVASYQAQAPVPNWGTEAILSRPAQVQQPMGFASNVAQSMMNGSRINRVQPWTPYSMNNQNMGGYG